MKRVLLALCVALPLFAHEGLHEQLAELTRRIAAQPQDAVLYLKRGELYRLHHEWDLAARDYEAARRLQPSLQGVDLALGMMLTDSGRAKAALVPLRRYAKQHADDFRGRIALARALVASGRAAEAAGEFEAAVKLTEAPDPDLLVESARALSAAGRTRDALALLDRLPNVIALQLAAIDLELASRNYDGALRRIDAAAASAVRKESWLARRGDVLVAAKREDEARAAYRAALDAIESLPVERRRAPATAQLEERLRRAIH
ncbi:MAG TPA: tetratricopeptide repeat protein [Thermoanaerobaculia bacterium]|nr:tetratricopeptide repeat protein [Thermoanaerobaculia bacterium]